MKSLIRYTATMLLAGLLVLTWGGRADAQLSPSLQFAPASAPAGSTVTIDGADFQPGETVNVDYGGRTIAQAIADSSGRFTARGTIDAQMPVGTHPLDANGSMGSFVNTGYTVTAGAPQGSVSPAPAPAPSPAPAPVPAPAAPGRTSTVIVAPVPDSAVVVPLPSVTTPDEATEVAVVETTDETSDGAVNGASRTGSKATEANDTSDGYLDRLPSSWAWVAFAAAFIGCLLVAFLGRRSRRARSETTPLAAA